MFVVLVKAKINKFREPKESNSVGYKSEIFEKKTTNVR